MPTGTPKNREEIIDLLSQCGTMSYQSFIDFLYSIPFLYDLTGQSPDAFFSKFTGQWNQTDSDKAKYDTDIYVSYQDKIYRSTVDNNKTVPGASVYWQVQGDNLASSISFMGLATTTTSVVNNGQSQLFIAKPGTYQNFVDGSNNPIVINPTDTNGAPTILAFLIAKYNSGTNSYTYSKAEYYANVASTSLPVWVDGAYVQGKQVVYAGQVYEAKVNVISGEKPGTSSKWRAVLDMPTNNTLFDGANKYFYVNDVATGYNIDATTGALNADNTSSVSEQIPVTAGDTVYVINRTGNGGFRFLDASNNPLMPLNASGVALANYSAQLNGGFKAPANAVKFQFTTKFNNVTNKENIIVSSSPTGALSIKLGFLPTVPDITKLKNNVWPLIIPGGTVAVTIDYTTGAISISIPASTRIVYNQTSAVTSAVQTVTATALNSYRWLIYDIVNNVFSLVQDTARLSDNYIVTGVFVTYSATHKSYLNATIWTLNTASQTGTLLPEITKLKNNFRALLIGGKILLTVNNTTGAVSVTIPASTLLVYGETALVTPATAQTVSFTAVNSYRWLVYDTVNSVFLWVTDAQRMSYILVGYAATYSALHVPIIQASSWSLNGVDMLNYKPQDTIDAGLVPKNYSFYLNPASTVMNYNAIIRLEATAGNPALLYNSDGTLKELYLVYMRFKPQGASTIIQIAWKNGSTVGVNNVVVASLTDSNTDYSANPIASFTLDGNSANGFAGIKFNLIIDLSKLPAGVTNADLSNTLRLNTLLFVEQLKAAGLSGGKPLAGKTIVCFGDSVTEFGTYPEQIALLTGATTYNIGFGGCRMGKRTNGSPTGLAYDKLAMYQLADAVATQNWTDTQNAVNYLRDNAADDNTPQFNRLMGINFANVDIVTIFFGTNDFTSDENPIGTAGSTDPLTIRGALNIVVNKLMTAYPNLRLVFITPTHRYKTTDPATDADTSPNALGLYLKDYCTAIVEEANSNHLPAINMYQVAGLNKFNHATYYVDGVHLTTSGYTYLANRLSGYLKTLYSF